MKKILIITVGGSHVPILTAIKHQQPDLTLFVCTDKDPQTGRHGSIRQITGEGNIINDLRNDEKPTLPNIPVQLAMHKDQVETLLVKADDLQQVTQLITASLTTLINRYPEASLIADYTCGTKSMSAGLVLAALRFDKIKLQLVSGSRVDLVKVASGTEMAMEAKVDDIRIGQEMDSHLQFWNSYGYAEAATGLQTIKLNCDSSLLSKIQRLRQISHAFACWDRFDHEEAYRILLSYRPVIGSNCSQYLNFLNALTTPDKPFQQPARMVDLWLNAQRRAVQGRYDDAVARCYRLWEWVAQWQLQIRFGINTSDIPKDKIPSNITLTPNREGKYQCGLIAGWKIIEQSEHKDLASFAKQLIPILLDLSKIRNYSILAHGYDPVTLEQWEPIEDWMNQSFIPFLHQQAIKEGFKLPIDQLQLPKSPDRLEAPRQQ